MQVSGDWTGMDCTTAREALSARLDGELSSAMDAALDEHLTDCPMCTAAAGALADASRRARVRVADSVPDLAPQVAARVRASSRPAPWSPARVALVVVAVAQLALAVPLLLGQAPTASDHTSREIGVTETALAVGLLAAAWRPWRAAGMLPVVVALALGLAAISVLDVVDGHVGVAGELPHLLPLAGALMLWQVRHRDPIPTAPAPVDQGQRDVRRSA